MNYAAIARLRGEIIALASRVSVVGGREARVKVLMDLHDELEQALAAEGVLLPCHDDKAASDRE